MPVVVTATPISQSDLIAALDTMRAQKGYLTTTVHDAVVALITSKDAALAALQAQYDAYVAAHP